MPRFDVELGLEMARVTIASLNDPQIGPYRQLKATNVTRDRRLFVVEGAKLVERLVESGYAVESVLATDRKADVVAGIVPESVPFYIVPHALVDVLVGFNFHQGVLACGVRRAPPAIEQVLGDAGATATLLACPRLDNPENLGAILRLADVFGVAAVLVGPGCPDPLSRRVLRVSMGMALRVPTLVAEDVPGELARWRREFGVGVVAAVSGPDAVPFDSFRRPARLALVLGREAPGVDAAVLAACDGAVTIPMRPGAESLNVAVAAGILLYHFTRPA